MYAAHTRTPSAALLAPGAIVDERYLSEAYLGGGSMAAAPAPAADERTLVEDRQ